MNSNWTKKEVRLLINNYNKISNKELANLLKRTESSIMGKISTLKLRRTNGKWTKKDIDILYKKYPFVSKKTICKLLSNKSWAAIMCQACKLGIKRHEYNIDGKKFGLLTATNLIKRVKNTSKRKFICKCGQIVWTATTEVLSGRIKSCGCYKRICRLLKPGQAARNDVLSEYKRSAKDRNLVWNLSDNQFDIIVKKLCYFCNTKPGNIRIVGGNNGEFIYNGIDRLDNDKGYTKNNCVPCCIICNRAKRDMKLKDFIKWIKNLSKTFYVK